MSTFYVGQRVRIIKATITPSFVGMEATVISPLRLAKNETEEWYGHSIDIDGVGQYNSYGKCICAEPEKLEPLTPPPKAITWELACFDRDGSYRAPVAA